MLTPTAAVLSAFLVDFSLASGGHDDCTNDCPTSSEATHESSITFSVFYGVAIAASLVVFPLRRMKIQSIIKTHIARPNDTDFSAVQNFTKYFNILNRMKSVARSDEHILWADVNFIIASWNKFFGMLSLYAAAVAVIYMTADSSVQIYLMPLLLFILFVGFGYVGMGLKQVVGNQHFKDIYAFTDTRVIIMKFSPLNCRKPAVEYIPFHDISDVKLVYRGDVGTVSFHARDPVDVELGALSGRSTRAKSGGSWSPFASLHGSYRELCNIIDPRSVEIRLLSHMAEEGKGKEEAFDDSERSYQRL